MRRRQPLPKTWLMTDPRLGTALFDAIRRLPSGSGIVMRHDHLTPPERRRLFKQISALARRYGHIVLRAGPDRLAYREHGVHRGPRASGVIQTMPAHDLREVAHANRRRADAVFLSPIFETRSHDDAKPLGIMRFATLARHSKAPVIALGGMDHRKWRRIRNFPNVVGWAAIDAWLVE